MRIIPLLFIILGAALFIYGLFLLDWNDPAVVFAASGIMCCVIAWGICLGTGKRR